MNNKINLRETQVEYGKRQAIKIDKSQIKATLEKLNHTAFELQQSAVRRNDDKQQYRWWYYRQALHDIAKELNIVF